MKTIRVHDLYEEAQYTQPTGWTVADEDKRIYQTEHFGVPNDAWATVVTAHLAEHRDIPKILEGLPLFRKGDPRMISVWLQLRVCSPTFQERDARFLHEGRHLALVQDEFQLSSVRAYIDKVVQKTAHISIPEQHEAWSRYFHLYDPDDDEPARPPEGMT